MPKDLEKRFLRLEQDVQRLIVENQMLKKMVQGMTKELSAIKSILKDR